VTALVVIFSTVLHLPSCSVMWNTGSLTKCLVTDCLVTHIWSPNFVKIWSATLQLQLL